MFWEFVCIGLIVWVFFSCLSAVFLHSQLAAQVLVRSRRANQMFEEARAGKAAS